MMEDLLRVNENGIAEMINKARERTQCVQLKKMKSQKTRGRPCKVGASTSRMERKKEVYAIQ